MSAVQTTTGKVKYTAREYSTKYGPRLQAKVTLSSGEEIPLWSPVDDAVLPSLKKGEEVKLIDSGKGWKLLMDADQKPVDKMPPQPPARWSQDDVNSFMGLVADYGAAYEFCLAKASEMVEKGLAPRENLVQIATTMFIQAIRKIGK